MEAEQYEIFYTDQKTGERKSLGVTDAETLKLSPPWKINKDGDFEFDEDFLVSFNFGDEIIEMRNKLVEIELDEVQSKIFEKYGDIIYIIPRIEHNYSECEFCEGQEIKVKYISKHRTKKKSAKISNILCPDKAQDIKGVFTSEYILKHGKNYFKNWFNKNFSSPKAIKCCMCAGIGEVFIFDGTPLNPDNKAETCTMCNGSGIEKYIAFGYCSDSIMDYFSNKKENKSLEIIVNPTCDLLRIDKE